MKKCTTCNMILNDSDTYCTRCGGRKIETVEKGERANSDNKTTNKNEEVIEKKQRIQRIAAEEDIKQNTEVASNTNVVQEQEIVEKATKKKEKAVKKVKEKPVKKVKETVAKKITNTDIDDTTVAWKEFIKLYFIAIIPIYGLIQMFKLKSQSNGRIYIQEFAKYMIALDLIYIAIILAITIPIVILFSTGVLIFI